MGGLVARRMLGAAAVLLAALSLAFAMLQLVPGDPVVTMLSAQGSPPTVAEQDALRHELGLDRSLPEQYLDFLAGLAHGDLGRSVQTGEPVSGMIGAALPVSAELAGSALAVGVVVGVGLAVARAATSLRPVRGAVVAVSVLGTAMPAYWVALMLIELVSFRLGWLPALGDRGVATLVLPTITVALPVVGMIAQVLGDGLDTALGAQYAATARAKGAGALRIVLRHALRNAAIPTVTLIVTTIGNVLAASVVAETVFARPGLGRLVSTAIIDRDLPVLQGVVVLLATLYVLVNLAVDLGYGWLDPRITTGRRLA